MLASGALANAPIGADCATKLQAIGRGVARLVVHELAHQFFPSDAIHSDDIESYEFPSAARPAQYRGTMRWSRAWPLLQARFGSVQAPVPAP